MVRVPDIGLRHRARGCADLRAEGADLPDAAFSVTDWTAYVLFIVIIGGIGTIEGPIIGVIIFFLLQSLLADYGSWYLFTLGIIGIVVMLFAPRGIWGLITDKTGIQLFPVRRRLSGGSCTLDDTAVGQPTKEE
jgi:branched-chain amino acid transport system permease protein